MENNSVSLTPSSFPPSPRKAPPLPPRNERVKAHSSKTPSKIISDPQTPHVISNLGQTALSTSETDISSKRTSPIKAQSLPNNGSKVGVWQSIVHYFNRYFGKVTPEEKEEAESIQTLIQIIHEHLEKTCQYTERLESAEKRNKNLFPSEETIRSIDLYIEKVALELTHVSRNLNSLMMKREKVNQLAKNRIKYGSLPLEIESLEKKIAYAEARLTVAHKLRDFEITLKRYGSYKTFENFYTILTEKKTLEDALREILSVPIFDTDKVPQNYLQKPIWITSDLYHLIQHTFPSFTGQIRRLSNNTLKIRDKRMENLHQKLLHLSHLSSIYHRQAYRIDNLERTLHDPSIIYRIYRFFHSSTKLSLQLEHAHHELQECYQVMMTYEKKLDPAEVKYIKDVNKFNPYFKLKNSINSMQQIISNTTSREKIADQLRQLIDQFNQLKPLTATSPTESLEVKELKLAIKKKMNQLSTDMVHISQSIDPQKISSKLMTLTALEQLQTLLPLAFPDLQFRINSLFEAIKKNNLARDLEAGINETLSSYIDAKNMPAEISKKTFSLILLQEYSKDKIAQINETPVEVQTETATKKNLNPPFNHSDLSDFVETLTSFSGVEQHQMNQEKQSDLHFSILEGQTQTELSPSVTDISSNPHLSKIPSPPPIETVNLIKNHVVKIAPSNINHFPQVAKIIQSAKDELNSPILVKQEKENPSLTSKSISLLDQIKRGTSLKKIEEQEPSENPKIEDTSLLGLLTKSMFLRRGKIVDTIEENEDDETWEP